MIAHHDLQAVCGQRGADGDDRFRRRRGFRVVVAQQVEQQRVVGAQPLRQHRGKCQAETSVGTGVFLVPVDADDHAGLMRAHRGGTCTAQQERDLAEHASGRETAQCLFVPVETLHHHIERASLHLEEPPAKVAQAEQPVSGLQFSPFTGPEQRRQRIGLRQRPAGALLTLSCKSTDLVVDDAA